MDMIKPFLVPLAVGVAAYLIGAKLAKALGW